MRNELVYSKEWENEDIREGRSPTKIARDILEGTMEGVQDYLKLTMETGEDFDGRLPTLDTTLWVDSSNIVHFAFYEKPMCLNQVLQKDTALPENTKQASLAQEMVRRMKNTSELLPMGERIVIVSKYAQKLLNSGYSHEQARKVIVNGLKGYEKKLRESKKGGKKLHLGARDLGGRRARKKLLAKSSWFRQKKMDDSSPEEIRGRGKKRKIGDEEEYGISEKKEVGKEENKKDDQKKELRTTSVLFLELTKGGSLAQHLREMEPRLSSLTGFRIRIVELGGRKLKDLLPNTNPWAGSKCGREGCATCSQGGERLPDCF